MISCDFCGRCLEAGELRVIWPAPEPDQLHACAPCTDTLAPQITRIRRLHNLAADMDTLEYLEARMVHNTASRKRVMG